MNKNISLFIMDVDGTLTNGEIICTGTQELFKAFNVKDGYGIAHLLPPRGIKTAIITGRESDIVSYRAKELKISYLYQGISDKSQIIKLLQDKLNISSDNIAYIGDDINDLPAMKLCGTCACPADALDIVKSQCDYICSRNGGYGAVREFIDYILNNNE